MPISPALRLSALYAALFAVGGVAMPFLPLWLAAQGVGPEGIGALLALPILVRIGLTAPLMGLVDRGSSPRALLVGGGCLAAGACALMPAAALGGWPALALAVAANAVGQCPLVPTADYLTLAALRRDPGLDYARIRLWGSLAYLAANLGAGILLTGLGAGAAIGLLAALTALGALAGALVPAPPRAAPGPAAGLRAPLPARLRLAILAAAAVQASHAAFYAFSGLHWRAGDLSEAAIGGLWAIGVAAEIALFAAYGRSGRGLSRPFALIGLGAGAGVARWLALALAPPQVALLAPVQLLHGLTFGATHLGTMAAVATLAPPEARGRAQGVVGAASALASAAATLGAGAAFRAQGGGAALLLMVPLAAAGLALALAGGATGRGRGA